MKILIAGGAGFVGSNLAIFFKKSIAGCRVTSFDNLRRSGSELNLPRLRHHGVDFVHGDIRSQDDLDAIKDADLIVDAAAEPSVMAGYAESPRYVIDTNIGGTVHLLETARRTGAAFVFLSTSRVYPMALLNQLRFTETATRFEPAARQKLRGVSLRGVSEQCELTGARSLYGATKLASELLVEEYRSLYGLRTVINRCGVISGPWQMGKVDQGFVVLWVARHIFGRPLTYVGYKGTGKQVRDVLHVEDLFELIAKQIANWKKSDGGTFNIGGGRETSVSLRELTELCAGITGQHVPIRAHKRTRNADIRWYVSDSEKARRIFRWRPKHDIESIVEDVAQWITDHRAELEPILDRN